MLRNMSDNVFQILPLISKILGMMQIVLYLEYDILEYSVNIVFIYINIQIFSSKVEKG